MLFDKKLFKEEEDDVNINVNLLVSSGDDFFDDEFNNEFDKMEKEDQFHGKLEDGFKTGKKCIQHFLFNLFSSNFMLQKSCESLVI